MKEDAIPSRFIFTPAGKKRKHYEDRQAKIAKKQHLNDALDENVEPSVSFSDYDNHAVQSKTVDKAIDASIKFKTKYTQYRLQDIPLKVSSKEVKTPLKVKFVKAKKTKEIGINTDISFQPLSTIAIEELPPLYGENIEERNEINEENENETDLDASFRMSDDELQTHNEINFPSINKPILSDEKFIVSLSSLKELLVFCRECHKRAHITNMIKKGTMLIVSLLCENNHDTTWHSQPKFDQGMAAGNLCMAASILLSGNTFQAIKEMMEIANVNFISSTTFYDLQKRYIFSAINKVYMTHRELRFANALEQPTLHLLGDGRCDSPGYNAKYGTYTLMNSESGEIMDFHVSHVSIAGNSQRMELDGLKNLIFLFESNGLQIDSLTTDRHKQVRCFLRKERPNINHQFDVWHVGKNILKKLVKEAKRKSCADLNGWIKSIINHFWWCCASCNGNSVELKEKWVSILCHVCNIHRWKSCTVFKKCLHAKLTKREQREKVWLKKNSPSYKALEKVVTNKSLISALKYLTSFNHTGTLEVYHSLYNKYCPKRLHFSYEGMVSRSQLAVLDFNSGVNRNQATTKKNELRYKLPFTKVTKSWVVKKIMEKKERLYLKDIMGEIEYQKKSGEIHPKADIPKDIPKNIAPTPKPNKKEAIESMRTRFEVTE